MKLMPRTASGQLIRILRCILQIDQYDIDSTHPQLDLFIAHLECDEYKSNTSVNQTKLSSCYSLPSTAPSSCAVAIANKLRENVFFKRATPIAQPAAARCYSG